MQALTALQRPIGIQGRVPREPSMGYFSADLNPAQRPPQYHCAFPMFRITLVTALTHALDGTVISLTRGGQVLTPAHPHGCLTRSSAMLHDGDSGDRFWGVLLILPPEK